MNSFSQLTEYDHSFIRYLLGITPGSFLQYVLQNDLMGAVGHADHINRYRLWEICSVVYNELPSQCHGSKDRVQAWHDLDYMKRLDILKNAKHLSLCDRAIKLHEDIQKRKEEANDRSKREGD